MAITFAVAGPADEADIRRLLRENPLGGGWEISLEREPDGLGGPHLPGERCTVVIARDSADGTAVGLCERLVRPAWIAGQKRLLPYLGALRIARSHRHRIAILRGGFQTLRDHAERADECPFALTSIAADNGPAQRLLTAGLKGFPRYRPIGSLATLMFRARACPADPDIFEAGPEDLPEISAFLAREGARRQFAPTWDEIAGEGLPGLSFLALRRAGAVVGTIGVWDQSQWRQVVVRGLPPLARGLRGGFNLVAPLLAMPAIPGVGERIEQAFMPALAASGDDPALALRLVRAALSQAASRGLRVGTLGLPVEHPWRAVLKRRVRAIEYLTDLYAVHWPEVDPQFEPREIRPVFPDVSLL
ncbi:hypothetical protein [Novosphingobium sp.]|uniref:hypothetical protein n=1 Tax=Novosphingobium sp. TaxID=1874826 RepID=UPI0025DAFDCC|nr:hypothetical protein [Novosphingobium sp.]MCC6926829.1 hypothetical protein [Novosphingobium sp.]